MMKKLCLLLLLFCAGIIYSQTEQLETEDEITDLELVSDELTQNDEDEAEEAAGTALPSEDAEKSSEIVKRPPFWITEQEEAAYEFPQWAKDLRRGEIIAFGSFPIMVFFTRMFMDIYRSANHGWDNSYAPWPFTGPNSVGLTDNEVKLMFSIAGFTAVLVSVADHFIIKHKRKKASTLKATTHKTPPAKQQPAAEIEVHEETEDTDDED
jgi:hypothetical protein